MTLSVSIEPLVPAIDMYDSPDTNSAYSLSGHITIAASPSSSILALPRSSPHNLLLTALELTFEGQSELVLPEIGYAPLRLLSITKQLVEPAHPVQITTDDAHAEWRVVFNLPVPGWLPASAVFGDHDGQGPTGVSYALYARARFHVAPADADDPAAPAAAGASPSSMWNNLCSVVRGAPRPRLVQAEKVAIRVTRYVSPPARAYHRAEGAAPPPFPRSTFAVQALSECAAGEAQATNIPAEILRAVELHAIVPSRTAVGDDTLPLLLRLRSRSPEEAARSRLRVMAFEANVVQVERYQ
ncbi:hypothetical protein JB92DRAFT_296499 [Gautieria morchelliformis]|nr:hypothetical protein JB92DRAFT_296499 [Gautieria morchelliformis]